MWLHLKYYAKLKKTRDSGAHIVSFCLYDTRRIGKSIETEGRLVATRGWEEVGLGGDYLMGIGFLLTVLNVS